MRPLKHLVRRALLAALVTLSLPALADTDARFDPSSGAIVVTGLEDETRAQIMADPDQLRLQVATLDSARGTPVTLENHGTTLRIRPRFALRPGTRYVLRLNGEHFDIRPAPPRAKAPILSGFAPSQAVIPANTLRLYLSFSEPMARGQLREAVRLVREDGTPVASPFLNLEAELWDPFQTRATLLLDPGRIKQGVGPNAQSGAPLAAGQGYRLLVSSQMQSAAGVPIGTVIEIAFRVGPAERRAIDPGPWQIIVPPNDSHASLTVVFDRIMDSGAVQRLLTLQDAQGRKVQGEITTDGGSWSLVPKHAWLPGTYTLVLDAALEDVSGNTPRAPFDAASGTIGAVQDPIIRRIDITG